MKDEKLNIFGYHGKIRVLEVFFSSKYKYTEANCLKRGSLETSIACDTCNAHYGTCNAPIINLIPSKVFQISHILL